MSIRTCVWPDCPARFPEDQGPTAQGWRVINRFLFCPFHNVGRHAIAVLRLNARRRPVQLGCLCLEWESLSLRATIDGIQDWQQHVRVAENGSG